MLLFNNLLLGGETVLVVNNATHVVTLSVPNPVQTARLAVNNISTGIVTEVIRLIPYYSLPIFWKITRNSQKGKSIIDLSARFGDNYQQIAPDGLNSAKDNWTLNWSNLTLAEKNIFEAAVNVRGSWEIYIWTPLYEITDKKFRMVKDSYSYQAISANSFNASIKIVQIFDLI